ncbi:MAG: hypothetical protein M3404_09820 [Actinomycetota bacterium]|nr:hypothetical protein [Actinomycetota bacterium]
MAWIRASCPTCGDVELSIGEVQLMMCASTTEGSYVFRCPACRLMVSKAAEDNVVDVLVASGVQLSVWHLPAELDEEHYGPPIGYDELLEFHFEIRGDAWMEELDRTGAPGGHRRGDLEPAGPHDQP